MEAWKDELYHHGILGMKWGVRRYQYPDGTRTELGKKRERERYHDSWSDDAKTAYEYKKRAPNGLSNSELRALNERKRLEDEYRRLNPSTIDKGTKYIANIGAITAGVVTLVNNADKLIYIGEDFAKRAQKVVSKI